MDSMIDKKHVWQGGYEMKGIPASPGMAMARAIVFQEMPGIQKETSGSVESELHAFERSLESMIARIEKLSDGSGQESEILRTHGMLLEDEALTLPIRKMIKTGECSASYAVDTCMRNIADQFRAMEDEYLSSRAADIDELRVQLLEVLSGEEKEDYSDIDEDCVLVMHAPMLSDIIRIPSERLKAIVTETGGATSHCAILARTKGIPAVMGINNICCAVKNDDLVIVDGDAGEVFVSPDEEEVSRYTRLIEHARLRKADLERRLQGPCMSADGKHIEICANIGSPDDAPAAIAANAEGIGLFRSEFLYIDKTCPPTEEEQYEAYRRVLTAIQGKPVTIRTLDAGGDKSVPCLNLPKEENPFLGYRAMRICLDHTSLFKTQIRALLRASGYGNLRIMLPMISSVEEVRRARAIICEVYEELRAEGINVAQNTPVGVMIEVPSAAIMAESIAKEADFFSIGTNDLVQYVMAADRGNERVAGLYSSYYPAVLRLLKHVVTAAHEAGIPCGVCGESAKEAEMLPFFIGIGMDELSMSAGSILEAKERISMLDSESCKTAAEKAAASATRDEAYMTLKTQISL